MDFGIGNMVHDMFTLGVPVWERIIRAVLVYALSSSLYASLASAKSVL